ncbi:MAG TPA: caspase family protein [Gemmataceae bacterium]|nr:caspase family protein [Gemmataceae bacterium]
MYRPLVRTLALLIALALPALPHTTRSARAARAARPTPKLRELKMLRVLLVIDNLDVNQAAGVDHDANQMADLLAGHIPDARLQIDRLDGRKVSRENILKYYRNLKAGPDEALLFFYAGHGAIDPKLGHCLHTPAGSTSRLPRSEVRKAMEQKGAGLVVLLTDCCSSRPKQEVPYKPYMEKIRVERVHPVFRCLFFQHRGTADITAAEDGTAAFGDMEGGVFTNALASILEGDLKTLDRNRDGFLSWKEFFPQLSRETQGQFKRYAARERAQGASVDQKTQRPRFFSLPRPLVSRARKTYAVVSLHNAGAKAVRYRYRWAGDREWKVATVAAKGRVLHDLPVVEAARLPHLEIEADLVADRGKKSLSPAKWSGKRPPAYRNGKEYSISAK